VARRKRTAGPEQLEPVTDVDDVRDRARALQFCGCGNLMNPVRERICAQHCPPMQSLSCPSS
jgi:hypothetical protein